MAYLGGVSVPGQDSDKKIKTNQDSFYIFKKKNSISLIVCDGAGSAKFSHLGAKAFSKNLGRFCLKNSVQFTQEEIIDHIKKGIKHIFKLLLRFSKIFKLNACKKDFATTILGFVQFSERLSIGFHIGDGSLIFLSKEEKTISFLSKPENGEYINQTFFITDDNWEEKLRFFKIDFKYEVLLAMTDGVTAMALKNNMPFGGFINPIINFLVSHSDEKCIEALKSSLSSLKATQISNDDKTFAWFLPC